MTVAHFAHVTEIRVIHRIFRGTLDSFTVMLQYNDTRRFSLVKPVKYSLFNAVIEIYSFTQAFQVFFH